MKEVMLEFRDVTLAHGNRTAIRDFQFTVYKGEYIAVMGADGSGKSALVEALHGEAACRFGEIRLQGKPYAPGSIQEAHAQRVFLISKTSNLIETQTVAENIFLNHGGSRAFHLVNDRLIFEEARTILAAFGLDIDARSPVGGLSRPMKCILEMVKWQAYGAKVIVLNHSLAAATPQEYALFLRVLDRVRAGGTAVLHVMNRCIDIFTAADRCVLLSPQGRAARVLYAGDFDVTTVNEYIGRREMRAPAPRVHAEIGPEILRAQGVSAGNCRNVSFSLHRGEMLGILYGEGGADASVALALCGVCPYSGTFFIDGKPVNIRSEADARKLGIGLVPSDLRALYYPDLTPVENVGMPFLRRVSNPLGVLEKGKTHALAQDVRQCLDDLDSAFPRAAAQDYMSCVLSRFLLYPYRILVLLHPSATNDVRKEDMVYHLIHAAAARGCALLIVSTSTTELQALCDKTWVQGDA